MTFVLGVVGFFATVTALSGPAFRERRERREQQRAFPGARVTYLPDSRCRSQHAPDGLDDETIAKTT